MYTTPFIMPQLQCTMTMMTIIPVIHDHHYTKVTMTELNRISMACYFLSYTILVNLPVVSDLSPIIKITHSNKDIIFRMLLFGGFSFNTC